MPAPSVPIQRLPSRSSWSARTSSPDRPSLDRNVLHFPVRHAAIGPHPEAFAVVLVDRAHDIVGQAGGGGKTRKHVGPVAAQPASAGADPEVALRVFEEHVDMRIRQLGRVLAFEDHEADPVEADEARLGAEPEMPVAGLDDGTDRILGKALLDGPDAVAVLRDRKPWIEAEDGPSPSAEGKHQKRDRERATPHSRDTADHSIVGALHEGGLSTPEKDSRAARAALVISADSRSGA